MGRLGVCLMLLMAGAGAEPTVTGAFRAEPATVFLSDTGPTTAAVEFSYPAHTVSAPGEYARWSLPTTSPGGPVTLVFHWADSFTGATAGYHVLQALIGARVVWEQDVAGGDLQPRRVTVPLAATDLPARGQPLAISFRLFAQKSVTNFAVRVQVANPTLQCEGQSLPLAPATPVAEALPWPPEPPLPALPPMGAWTWQASIVQPWGATQTLAIKQAAQWAPRFGRDHGLNAIIFLPPDAHNAITGVFDKPHDPGYVTDAEFRAALALYRREGLRLILYSSVMHMGHAPRWQFGELARTHPEWAMRDAAGDTVNLYGQPWLCPATGALPATLDYARALMRAYDADAVMLDNNEFMVTRGERWTCHCLACQTRFSEYLVARFGDRCIPGTTVNPAAAAIPDLATDPLWGLWLAFRNRLWAEACETYRRELRQLKPNLVLLANTQYLYATGVLAVDGQYPHLDAVLSESRGQGAVLMMGKMLLGRALAEGRPLWNYLGTFNEQDHTRLRVPDEVAGLCAASSAAGANPWVVFYGFTGDENQASLAVLRRYNDFWHDNAALLGASVLRGEVGLLVSTESRDLCHTPLVTPTMAALLGAGIPLRPVRDHQGLTPDSLQGLRVLTATQSPCMHQATAEAVGAWVKQGGALVITPPAGWRDEYGRWRRQSALSQALGSTVTPVGQHLCGQGRVVCVPDEASALAVVQPLVTSPVRAATAVGVFRHQATDGRRALGLVGINDAIGDVTVTLPATARHVELRMPGHPPRALPSGPRVTCTIPERLGLIVY